nr:MAG TPA: hypothetical protein [Caudoviricetes sp.]
MLYHSLCLLICYLLLMTFIEFLILSHQILCQNYNILFISCISILRRQYNVRICTKTVHIRTLYSIHGSPNYWKSVQKRETIFRMY